MNCYYRSLNFSIPRNRESTLSARRCSTASVYCSWLDASASLILQWIYFYILILEKTMQFSWTLLRHDNSFHWSSSSGECDCVRENEEDEKLKHCEEVGYLNSDLCKSGFCPLIRKALRLGFRVSIKTQIFINENHINGRNNFRMRIEMICCDGLHRIHIVLRVLPSSVFPTGDLHVVSITAYTDISQALWFHQNSTLHSRSHLPYQELLLLPKFAFLRGSNIPVIVSGLHDKKLGQGLVRDVSFTRRLRNCLDTKRWGLKNYINGVLLFYSRFTTTSSTFFEALNILTLFTTFK